MRVNSIRHKAMLVMTMTICTVVMVAHASDFYAYYTRLDYDIPIGPYKFDFNDPWEDDADEVKTYDVITGRYADVVVNLEDGKQFVFGRETSYQPYLKVGNKKYAVDEIVSRQPDTQCHYSYARIIESTPDMALVHLRYMPDLSKVGFADVVHEFYLISSDGSVKRKVRQATGRVDEWNVAKQQLKLTEDGIEEIKSEPLHLVKEEYVPVKGSTVKDKVVGEPIFWLRFDEGISDGGNRTVEAIQGKVCVVEGNKSLWKAGISGSALAFDGYTSKIDLPSPESPDYLREQLTVEAWIALGAYPWNDTAIVQQTNPPASRPKGYFLGLNETGNPLLRIFVDGRWYTLVASKPIELYRWTHIAATFDAEEGKMSIYIDGKESGRLSGIDGSIQPSPKPISVGLNNTAGEATRHVSEKIERTPEGSQPWIWGIEGLIDEIKIYNTALSAKDIAKSYKNLKPSAKLRDNPDLEKRTLPGEVGVAKNFGAQYKTLKYHELWENLFRTSDFGDVVVKFDEMPVSVIFWRGTNYGANYVTDGNFWMADQSVEVGTWCGCSEHMSDKECRYAHVRVIENTDARVLVHWRYASTGVMYNFPHNYAWTDEYHTIYPDGVAMRKVNYHGGNAGWNDTQFLAQPGHRPEDVMNLKSVTAANMNGDTFVMDWTDGIPPNKLDDSCIRWINFKSDYKVFVVYPGDEPPRAWGDAERGDGFGIWAGPWNHWPVSQLPNDGRFAVTTDRLTHSALGGGDVRGNMAMFGLTNKSAAELAPLARSWKQAPKLIETEGCTSEGYIKEERAYRLTAKGSEMSFSLDASKKSPVVNPCFVIKKWASDDEAVLKIDGKSSSAFRQGIIRDTDGTQTLVVWLKTEKMSPMKVELSR